MALKVGPSIKPQLYQGQGFVDKLSTPVELVGNVQPLLVADSLPEAMNAKALGGILKPTFVGIDLSEAMDAMVVQPIAQTDQYKGIKGWQKALNNLSALGTTTGTFINEGPTAAPTSYTDNSKVETVGLPKPQPAVMGITEEQALVNELIDLESRMLKLEVPEMLKRKDELKKLLSKTITAPQHEAVVWKGIGGELQFSACSKEFKLGDKPGLISALGPDVTLEVAKFGITDLKKVLSENELALYGAYGYTDSRSVKIIVKA